MQTLAGIALIALVATAGDYLWYSRGIRHTTIAGLVHGAVLLTAVGGVLGAAAGRLLKGLPIGAIAGLGGAASYYAIVSLVGGRTYGAAIPAAWVILWLILAAFDGRWLRSPEVRSWPSVVLRGVIAAVLAGLAFYAVVGVLWGRPPAGGRNYFLQWAAWAFAWAPGIIALTAGSRPRPARPAGASFDSTPPLDTSALSARESRETSASSITPAELMARIDRGEPLRILDVRTEWEFQSGHVPGAVNIPFNQVPFRMNEVPGAAGDELILYCGHGPRAYVAAVPLKRERRVVMMTGHWAGWQHAGLREEQ